MHEATDPIERAGYVARIYYDEDASSPADWCNVGSLAFQNRSDHIARGDLPAYWDEYGLETVLPADAVAILPIYAYDGRGGTVISVAESWERANGWIYTDGTCACGCGAVLDPDADAARLQNIMRSDLDAWNQYFAGDVYGVIVTDPAGNEVDSCWGFYGLEYAKEEARGMLDLEEVHLLEAHPALANLQVN